MNDTTVTRNANGEWVITPRKPPAIKAYYDPYSHCWRSADMPSCRSVDGIVWAGPGEPMELVVPRE